jgi:hypothetical protein
MTNASQVNWKPGVLNGVLLGLLIGGVFAFNYVVDPFNVNRSFALGLEKRDVSYNLSNYAWKYPEYQHDPQPSVILGDSRARRLPAEAFEAVDGEGTYNFAFGGATGGDVIETFWFALEQGALKRVYMGLGALLLNDSIAVERGRRDRELLASPLQYYFSPFVTGASVRVVLRHTLGIEGPDETPPMSPEAFWEYQLTVPPRQYYGSYLYPTKLLGRLKEVAAVCAERDIELVFFMPPTHVDLQAKRMEYQIEGDYQRALRELELLAPVYDWDYPNVVTQDAALFSDPFHPKDAVAKRVARELAAGNELPSGLGFAQKKGKERGQP